MGNRDVIVLGGTGFLGRRVVRKLQERGRTVRVATRFPETDARTADDWGCGARLVRVDIRDHDTLTHALEAATAVVNCVGLYVETPAESFRDVHVEGARAVAEVARAQGLERLVHISGIGTDPRSPSAYIRARAEGEEQVRHVFPAATILRPSAMFSRDGEFFGPLETIVRRLPVVPMFGDGSTRLQPVHVGDVAEAICRVLESGKAVGTVFELGGPETFTYREILERLARRIGRRRLFLPVPFVLWRFLAGIASLLPQAPITPAQVTLMRQDNVVGDGMATFTDLSIPPQSAIAMDLV
jgi:NADH dehydrogenase